MRRILTGLTLVLLSLGLTSTAALADHEPSHYEQDSPDVVMGDTTLRPGDSTTVSGDHCPPNSTVTFTMVDKNGNRTVVGSTTADSQGRYSGTVTIPSGTKPGRYTLETSCGDEVAGVQFTITAPQATNARTGTNSIPMTGAGIALVLFGTALVAVARRVRSARSAA